MSTFSSHLGVFGRRSSSYVVLACSLLAIGTSAISCGCSGVFQIATHKSCLEGITLAHYIWVGGKQSCRRQDVG